MSGLAYSVELTRSVILIIPYFYGRTVDVPPPSLSFPRMKIDL